MPQCRDFGGLVTVCLAVVVLGSAIGTLISGFIPSNTAVPGSGCYRTCTSSDRRICSFEFTVHRYQTLSRACRDCPSNLTHCSLPHCITGNGIKRLVTVADRQLPGPGIHVCEGDTILMKVRNALPSTGISLHWHGLSPTDPYMDGAGSVGPALIPPQREFKYSLEAKKPGTHYWHSGAGFESGDGLFGPLVIRQITTDDINSKLYDYDLPEHTIVMNDWLHIPTMETYTLHHHSGGDHLPMDLLINGKGKYSGDGSTPVSERIPEEIFNVQPNKRYRFRLISAAFTNCPVSFTVSEHQFKVIATDGAPIVPYNASELILQPGERWDIVLKTDQQFSNHYMLFTGLLDCSVNEVKQRAIIRYVDSVSSPFHFDDEMYEEKALSVQPYHQDFKEKTINPVSGSCSNDHRSVCLGQLYSSLPLNEDLNKAADVILYLEFNLRKLDNPSFYDSHMYSVSEDRRNNFLYIPSPQINNLTFSSLPSYPTTPDSSSVLCNLNSKRHHCAHQFCQCVHMHKVPLGAVVDIILVDAGGENNNGQSIHFHGHTFRVLGQGNLPVSSSYNGKTKQENVLSLHSSKDLHNGSDNPIIKDTVLIPEGGYTLVRFNADNPGYWPLHSQILFHWASGMNVVLKVGEDSDLPTYPPDGMNWCSSR